MVLDALSDKRNASAIRESLNDDKQVNLNPLYLRRIIYNPLCNVFKGHQHIIQNKRILHRDITTAKIQRNNKPSIMIYEQ